MASCVVDESFITSGRAEDKTRGKGEEEEEEGEREMSFRRYCVRRHCDLLPTNITLDRSRAVTADKEDGRRLL
jgi:hypothetical protein